MPTRNKQSKTNIYSWVLAAEKYNLHVYLMRTPGLRVQRYRQKTGSLRAEFSLRRGRPRGSRGRNKCSLERRKLAVSGERKECVKSENARFFFRDMFCCRDAQRESITKAIVSGCAKKMRIWQLEAASLRNYSIWRLFPRRAFPYASRGRVRLALHPSLNRTEAPALNRWEEVAYPPLAFGRQRKMDVGGGRYDSKVGGPPPFRSIKVGFSSLPGFA